MNIISPLNKAPIFKRFLICTQLIVMLFMLVSPERFIPNWISVALGSFAFSDKVAHYVLFFWLIIFLHWSTNLRRRLLLCIAFLIASFTELSQFLSDRTPSLGDLMANFGGAVSAYWMVGVFTFLAGSKLFQKNNKKCLTTDFKHLE